MNININWPTQHQFAVFGSHVVVGAGGAIAAMAFTGVLSPADVATATDDVKRIASDVADLVGAIGSLAAISMGVFSTIRSGPLSSFFRAAAAIASSKKLTDMAKLAPIAQKADIVAITDNLPEVAGVATVDSRGGKALATAVPSITVQVAS